MREAMQPAVPVLPADRPIPGDVFWSPEPLPSIGDAPEVDAHELGERGRRERRIRGLEPILRDGNDPRISLGAEKTEDDDIIEIE